jgi:hypothetical protein
MDEQAARPQVFGNRLSARVATDVLPLLVNACSDACVAALPQGAERHVRDPHSGGRHVVQPEPFYRPRD